jgi:linoleoyl-CoA desaturase
MTNNPSTQLVISDKIIFNKNKRMDFYPDLRKRVDAYFASAKVNRHANWLMYSKILFILSTFVGTYLLILSNLFSPMLMFALALLHGFAAALIGLNIAHDAIHGSLSSNPRINNLFGLLFNIVGANDYLWRIKHNIIHHTYTNIPGHDDDINQTKLLRFDRTQEWRPMHRFQHIYMFLLYPLATISWVISKDYRNFFKSEISKYDNTNKPKVEYYRLFLYKIVYYVLFVAIPFTVINLPWQHILLGFVCMHLVAGITLALIFQLAHVVEDTDFPMPDNAGNMEENWAVHQLYTTANFATKHPVVNYLFGGLNFQVEHHLFPKICHVHYANIAPIVRQAAKEYGLPYHDNPTFFGAIGSHIATMRALGSVK